MDVAEYMFRFGYEAAARLCAASGMPYGQIRMYASGGSMPSRKNAARLESADPLRALTFERLIIPVYILLPGRTGPNRRGQIHQTRMVLGYAKSGEVVPIDALQARGLIDDEIAAQITAERMSETDHSVCEN